MVSKEEKEEGVLRGIGISMPFDEYISELKAECIESSLLVE